MATLQVKVRSAAADEQRAVVRVIIKTMGDKGNQDIVPKGTFPKQHSQATSSNLTKTGLLSATQKDFSVEVKSSPSIKAEGFFKSDTTGGKFSATANFKLTATLATGW